MRDSFDRIAGLGIAFPDSYSWTTCGFSLIACASAAWVIPLASLAVMMRFLSSEGTLELEWVMMLSFDFGLREREGHSRGILPRFLPHPSSLLTSRRPQQPGTCRPPHFVRTQASPTSGTDFIGTSSR